MQDQTKTIKPYKKFGALSSSEDPSKLGDSVKALIMGSSVLIIFVAHLFGVNIVTAEITNFAIGAGTAASSLWLAYGLIKKFLIWIHTAYTILQKRKVTVPAPTPGDTV